MLYDNSRSPGVFELPPDPPQEWVKFPPRVQYDPQPGVYNSVGKVINWNLDRAGVWHGVLSSEGYRWQFGLKDLQGCSETDIHEGMYISFRSLYHEDNHGIGDADQVRPLRPGDQQQQPKQPEPRPSVSQQQFERLVLGTAEEAYGVVAFYGSDSHIGFIDADGVRYKFSDVDVIRGVPTQGSMARFRAVAGDPPRAIEVEIA